MIKRLFILLFIFCIYITPLFSIPYTKEFYYITKTSSVVLNTLDVIFIFSTPLIAESEFSDNMYNYYSHFCHQLPERSFFINDHQLPVCARCTGIALGNVAGELGLIIGEWINPYKRFRLKRSVLYCLALSGLALPLIIDGSVQLFTDYESNNGLRLATGILFGISITAMTDELIRILDYYI
jgi:uncharacterized membrane protein